MATLNIRNLPEETLRALRVAAARHGRSMEAEVRALIAREYAPAPAATPAQVQARVRALYGGAPPAGAVDDFLRHRGEDFDD